MAGPGPQQAWLLAGCVLLALLYARDCVDVAAGSGGVASGAESEAAQPAAPISSGTPTPTLLVQFCTQCTYLPPKPQIVFAATHVEGYVSTCAGCATHPRCAT